MKLHFLGIGSAYNTSWYNSNAFFFQENSLFLLDCGESTFARLMEKKLLCDVLDSVYVFITHLHADHAGSLPSLCSYMAGHMKKKAQIIYPGNEVDIYLKLAGIQPEDYEHQYFDQIFLPSLQANAIPTEHISGYPSYGWLLNDKSGKYYFSGDSRNIPAVILEKLLEGRMQMVYHDVEWNSEEKENACHLQYQTLLNLIPPECRNHFCCMHLNCDFRDRAAKDGFLFATMGA